MRFLSGKVHLSQLNHFDSDERQIVMEIGLAQAEKVIRFGDHINDIPDGDYLALIKAIAECAEIIPYIGPFAGAVSAALTILIKEKRKIKYSLNCRE